MFNAHKLGSNENFFNESLPSHTLIIIKKLSLLKTLSRSNGIYKAAARRKTIFNYDGSGKGQLS